MKKFFIVLLIGCTILNADAKKILPPLMGWSSWNTYRVNINDELIRKQADALVEKGLKEAGYIYVNVDDGFFGWRDENGKMHSHPERFPNGMKPISDYIHSLGLKAGIYSDAGGNTCGSIYDKDKNGIGSGFYGHEQIDMDLYLKEWNYDFIKIDYCGALELGLDEEKRYEAIYNAIKNTGRDDVSINICRWAFPGTWAKRFARSWRISPDITPEWWSVKNIIEKNMYLSAYVGNGHYNDMDMLEIGRGLKPEEEIVHFGMWCIMSSPLLIGCDMTNIPKSSLDLLKNKELIEINQDPLGLQAYVLKHDNEGYVFVKDLNKKRGTKRAVAFYNPTDKHISLSVSVKELGFEGYVKVRDLVNHIDKEKSDGDIKCMLKPRSAAFYEIKGDERIEPSFYEAEWAYLPCYNDLGKNSKLIRYSADASCSGKMKVGYLGGSDENYAEWNEVYSKEGGKYDITIDYVCDDIRKLDLYVNGIKTEITNLISGKGKKASVTVPVILNKGYNVIRMGNSYAWAPDIDCFTLSAK